MRMQRKEAFAICAHLMMHSPDDQSAEKASDKHPAYHDQDCDPVHPFHCDGKRKQASMPTWTGRSDFASAYLSPWITSGSHWNWDNGNHDFANHLLMSLTSSMCSRPRIDSCSSQSQSIQQRSTLSIDQNWTCVCECGWSTVLSDNHIQFFSSGTKTGIRWTTMTHTFF